jgi:hypothetical protein
MMITATSHPQVIPAQSASGAATESTTAHRGAPFFFSVGFSSVDTDVFVGAGVGVAAFFRPIPRRRVVPRRGPRAAAGAVAALTRGHRRDC